MVRWQLLPEMRNIFYLARLDPPDLCTSFRCRYGDVNLSGYSWSGWAELTEKPNAHFITEKINQKKISTGRSSLSLRVWLLDTVAGLQPADFNTSHFYFHWFFSVWFKDRSFSLCLLLSPKLKGALVQIKQAILQSYFILPDVVYKDSCIHAKRSSHCSQTGHHLGSNPRTVYELPPKQGTGEGYILVKHQKAFKTLCHCRSVRTGWKWAS